MLGTILDEWIKEVKEKVEGFAQELKTDCDFGRLEGVLCGMASELENTLLQAVLDEVFADEGFLGTLKQVGAALGQRGIVRSGCMCIRALVSA